MDRDKLMARTRAARDFCNRVPHSAAQQERLELEAFMSLFHPGRKVPR